MFSTQITVITWAETSHDVIYRLVASPKKAFSLSKKLIFMPQDHLLTCSRGTSLQQSHLNSAIFAFQDAHDLIVWII